MQLSINHTYYALLTEGDGLVCKNIDFRFWLPIYILISQPHKLLYLQGTLTCK